MAEVHKVVEGKKFVYVSSLALNPDYAGQGPSVKLGDGVVFFIPSFAVRSPQLVTTAVQALQAFLYGLIGVILCKIKANGTRVEIDYDDSIFGVNVIATDVEIGLTFLPFDVQMNVGNHA